MAERLDDMLASWQRDLRAADKAPRTIDIYSQAVRFYARWLEQQGRPATSDELTKHAISGWLGSLTEAGQQPQTVLTRYKGMRRFVRWAQAEGDIDTDPMANLEQPKPKPHPVPVLSDDEIARLLKATDGAVFEDRRDHAMIRVLLDCGLRISELARLTVDDIDLRDHDVIRVVGKGRKVRVVPFGAKTGRALDRYRKARAQHKHADLPAWWLSQRGGMTHDGVDDRLKVRAAQAGVDNLHAHRFRHTAAHDWLLAGGQERDLMRIMGWSSDAMLDRYGSSMADQRALEAHRRMRRGDRL